MSTPSFFTLIIGTEILNRRRSDAHFDFVTKALSAKGHKLTGSFIIEDDPALIIQTIKFIASQPNPVLFSFGGIGSTPDDYTRKCAAIALRGGEFVVHEEAKRIIEAKLGKVAYPHPIKMAELPKGAELLNNPVNNMPAFSLDERYFFMPGFPEMSHPMVTEILAKLIPQKREIHRYTLTAHCTENIFVELMEQTPPEVECSSLPKRETFGWSVTLSLSSQDDALVQNIFMQYCQLLDTYAIDYQIES